MKEVTMIYAKDFYVYCPYCGAKLEGWDDAPYNQTDKCDYCKKEFKVSAFADIESE